MVGETLRRYTVFSFDKWKTALNARINLLLSHSSKEGRFLQLCCHATADLVQSHSCCVIVFIYTCMFFDYVVLIYGLSSFVAMSLCNYYDTCCNTALLSCRCVTILMTTFRQYCTQIYLHTT